ncbi:MAG: hypothetical protein K0U93_29265 [Gammaproteobacteria bacterium]|nr:hypothetical protein [Gammaproteobacteria bacterium]
MKRAYRKKSDQVVTAVQLDLDTPGFTYVKWGAEQRCRPGDWLVNNDGEVYTVERESFSKTYEMVSPGVYHKSGVVWAEPAQQAGKIATKEGTTTYEAGDYIVFNDADATDGYAVVADRFTASYEPLD